MQESGDSQFILEDFPVNLDQATLFEQAVRACVRVRARECMRRWRCIAQVGAPKALFLFDVSEETSIERLVSSLASTRVVSALLAHRLRPQPAVDMATVQEAVRAFHDRTMPVSSHFREFRLVSVCASIVAAAP